MNSSYATGSQARILSEAPRLAKLAELGYAGQPAGISGPGESTLGVQSATMPTLPSTEAARRLPGFKPAPRPDGSLRGRLSWALRSTEPNKRLGGICNNTISRICYLVLIVGVLAAAWVLSVRAIEMSPDPNQNGEQEGPGSSLSSTVFIHIVFAISTLALLITLYQTVLQVLAERRAFAHPHDVLPRYNTYEADSDNYAPLRTRMRPLWLSGTLREGRTAPAVDADVPAMVGPPPPAYGRTRGSTLLLKGLPALRELEGQR